MEANDFQVLECRGFFPVNKTFCTYNTLQHPRSSRHVKRVCRRHVATPMTIVKDRSMARRVTGRWSMALGREWRHLRWSGRGIEAWVDLCSVQAVPRPPVHSPTRIKQIDAQ